MKVNFRDKLTETTFKVEIITKGQDGRMLLFLPARDEFECNCIVIAEKTGRYYETVGDEEAYINL